MNGADGSAAVLCAAGALAQTGAVIAAVVTAKPPEEEYVPAYMKPLPPNLPKPKAPHVAYLHDTKILIAAIWPDAPPTASLDDIAAKARAHREIFEKFHPRIARLSFPPQ